MGGRVGETSCTMFPPPFPRTPIPPLSKTFDFIESPIPVSLYMERRGGESGGHILLWEGNGEGLLRYGILKAGMLCAAERFETEHALFV